MVRNVEFKRLRKYRTPFVLGHDGTGVVTRVGGAVRDVQVGDEVYARPRDLQIRTFAQYIAIKPAQGGVRLEDLMRGRSGRLDSQEASRSRFPRRMGARQRKLVRACGTPPHPNRLTGIT
jgi:hypothetical protein